MNKEIYLDAVLEQIPRLLGLLDRNIGSKTYGCFDRSYWHYHVADFPCSRSQEACLTLALLYSINNKKNIYYKNDLILEWIKASLQFWAKMQDKNGSFSEWYPNENSFVATAFSSYAISETLICLPQLKSQELTDALNKAAKWISKKSEKDVQNQQIGAILALYNVYLLTNNENYKKYSVKMINLLKDMQSDEGWFLEYKGADIGYLSLAVDYLAKFYKKSKNKDALQMAEKGISFTHNFIHPNLTFGGEYGSRNTEYLIPDGFEIVKTKEAESVSYFIRKSLLERRTIAPFSFDDRYLSYISYTYLQAFMDAKENVSSLKINYKTKYFEKSGLFIFNDNYFLVSNLNKGGSFKAFFKNKNIYDSGIILVSKKRYFSGYLQDCVKYCDVSSIKAEGFLNYLNDTKMSPLKIIISRVFQFTFGRFDLFGRLIKNILRRLLITGNKKSSIKYKREIFFKPNLKIVDTIYDAPVSKIILGVKSSYTPVPSSKYFQKAELDNIPLAVDITKKTNVRITREFDSNGSLKYIVEYIDKKTL